MTGRWTSVQRLVGLWASANSKRMILARGSLKVAVREGALLTCRSARRSLLNRAKVLSAEAANGPTLRLWPAKLSLSVHIPHTALRVVHA
jgi:hypothetical protein